MQSTSSSFTLACFIACLTSRTTHLLWCAAVSLGKKPVPGGETKVCLKFERICTGGEEGFFRDCVESSSEWALSCGDGGAEVGCRMTPTPSLLAEPSRPIAMGMVKMWCGVVFLVVVVYLLSQSWYRSSCIQ